MHQALGKRNYCTYSTNNTDQLIIIAWRKTDGVLPRSSHKAPMHILPLAIHSEYFAQWKLQSTTADLTATTMVGHVTSPLSFFLPSPLSLSPWFSENPDFIPPDPSERSTVKRLHYASATIDRRVSSTFDIRPMLFRLIVSPLAPTCTHFLCMIRAYSRLKSIILNRSLTNSKLQNSRKILYARAI